MAPAGRGHSGQPGLRPVAVATRALAPMLTKSPRGLTDSCRTGVARRSRRLTWPGFLQAEWLRKVIVDVYEPDRAPLLIRTSPVAVEPKVMLRSALAANSLSVT